MVLEADRHYGVGGCVVCGERDNCGVCVEGDCALSKVVYCATHLVQHEGHSLFGGEEICMDCGSSVAALTCFNCGKKFCCERLGSKIDGGVRAVCMFCLRAISRRK